MVKQNISDDDEDDEDVLKDNRTGNTIAIKKSWISFNFQCFKSHFKKAKNRKASKTDIKAPVFSTSEEVVHQNPAPPVKP